MVLKDCFIEGSDDSKIVVSRAADIFGAGKGSRDAFSLASEGSLYLPVPVPVSIQPISVLLILCFDGAQGLFCPLKRQSRRLNAAGESKLVNLPLKSLDDMNIPRAAFVGLGLASAPGCDPGLSCLPMIPPPHQQ